jgi:hypothetical protein
MGTFRGSAIDDSVRCLEVPGCEVEPDIPGGWSVLWALFPFTLEALDHSIVFFPFPGC